MHESRSRDQYLCDKMWGSIHPGTPPPAQFFKLPFGDAINKFEQNFQGQVICPCACSHLVSCDPLPSTESTRWGHSSVVEQQHIYLAHTGALMDKYGWRCMLEPGFFSRGSLVCRGLHPVYTRVYSSVCIPETSIVCNLSTWVRISKFQCYFILTDMD